MTKMLVVWTSFGSRLLVRFHCQHFTLFSSRPTYATLQTDRQADKFEKITTQD